MKHLLAVAALSGLMSLGAISQAQAAPAFGPHAVVSSGNVDITLVAQGCGPGGVRGRYGRCVYRRPPPPPMRRCPPGMHPTPGGCRPNF